MGHADNKKPIHQCFSFVSVFLMNFMCTLEWACTEQNTEQASNFFFTYPKPFELQNVAENESPKVYIFKHQFMNHL